MRYFPKLRFKQGEVHYGVVDLDQVTSEKLVPIFLVSKIVDEKERYEVLNSNGKHRAKSSYEVGYSKKLGASEVNELFFDFTLVGWDRNTVNRILISNSEKAGIFYDLTSPDSYTELITNLANDFIIDSNKVIIQADPENFDWDKLNEVLQIIHDNTFGTDYIKILLDYRDEFQLDVEYTRQLIRGIKAVVDLSFNYKIDVFISVSSIPLNMSEIEKDSIYPFNRVEADILELISEDVSDFSDYGIVSAVNLNEDVNFPGSVSLRYSTYSRYVFFRGHKQRSTEDRSELISEQARRLVQSEYYFGRRFSPGDQFNYEQSIALKGGNPSQWVGYATNHHVHVISHWLNDEY